MNVITFTYIDEVVSVLARIVFYLIAAPVSVVICLLVPVLYVGIMLLCPLGFIYRYFIYREPADTPPPLSHGHQNG